MSVLVVDLPADLPVGLPIWALKVEMWNCHFRLLDVSIRGSRSAYMNCNSSNVKLPFFTIRCQYQGGRSASRYKSWSAYGSLKSSNVKLPFLNTGFQSWPVDLPIWAFTVTMWNCHSWLLDVITRGVDVLGDLTVDLPIWALTIAIWNCLSWPLHVCTRG